MIQLPLIGESKQALAKTRARHAPLYARVYIPAVHAAEPREPQYRLRYRALSLSLARAQVTAHTYIYMCKHNIPTLFAHLRDLKPSSQSSL